MHLVVQHPLRLPHNMILSPNERKSPFLCFSIFFPPNLFFYDAVQVLQAALPAAYSLAPSLCAAPSRCSTDGLAHGLTRRAALKGGIPRAAELKLELAHGVP